MFDTTINDAVMSELETWVLSSEQLETVFNNSRPGEVIVYAVGDLAYECGDNEDGTPANPQAAATRKLATDLNRSGMSQKRLAPGRFEYRIEKA